MVLTMRPGGLDVLVRGFAVGLSIINGIAKYVAKRCALSPRSNIASQSRSGACTFVTSPRHY